jgi:hypothetical protein
MRLTYEFLTPSNEVPDKKLIVPQPVKAFPEFDGFQMFITSFIKPFYVSVS